MLSVHRIFEINAALKPLACTCLDVRGRTKSKCPDCGGQGGMKGCHACLGTGMVPENGRVCVCSACAGRGYLFHEFTPSMRALITQRRRQRAQMSQGASPNRLSS